MKRFIALILIALIVLTIAGCGEAKEYKKIGETPVLTSKVVETTTEESTTETTTEETETTTTETTTRRATVNRAPSSRTTTTTTTTTTTAAVSDETTESQETPTVAIIQIPETSTVTSEATQVIEPSSEPTSIVPVVEA